MDANNKLIFTKKNKRKIVIIFTFLSFVINLLFLSVTLSVVYYETIWGALIIPVLVLVNSFILSVYRKIKMYEVEEHGFIKIGNDKLACSQIFEIEMPFQDRTILKVKYAFKGTNKEVYLISPEFGARQEKFFPEKFNSNYVSMLEEYLLHFKG